MASSGNASPEDEDEPRRYQIEYSEAAQEEIEKAYLWRSSITCKPSFCFIQFVRR